MYIKAVTKNFSPKGYDTLIFEIGKTYTSPESRYHFVKNSPSTICGHPGFENPHEWVYLEIKPSGDLIEVTSDGTYTAKTITILREIELDELIQIDPHFVGWVEEFKESNKSILNKSWIEKIFNKLNK